ncbi:MAG TPA: hypothetical protein PKL92_00250 [Aquaticitalea sp.]|nr:hypothetical protein [Aquaticitalea sp.]HNU58348.1 hypothetical protein [Aquaticitalea sp.]
MSKDLQNKTSEEIDLGQIFNAIGKMFDRLFKFIGGFFKVVFTLFMSFLKVVIDNLITVAIVVGIAFAVGYFFEKNKAPVYEASMLVKPYYNSKYQLIANVNYYNSLLEERNFEVLSNAFGIAKEDAQKIKSFEVESGPETKNDLLKQYDLYLKSLDSSRALSITYVDFVENRNIYSSELYLITVKSLKKDIFKSLEKGFDDIFINELSIAQKQKRDKTFEIKKTAFESTLSKIDTLQQTYLKIVQKEADKGEAFVNVQGLLPLQQERSKTHEYELFQYEIRIRDSIREIEQLKADEDIYYDILSGFPKVGKVDSSLLSRYYVLFPIIAFILLCIGYMTIKLYKFIKNYES